MKSYIIGIAGVKNSGKDTVASIINYIFAVGATKADYKGWLINKESYNLAYKDRIIHFADGLKDVLSIIYSIPRKHFDNRFYKDELYYNLKTNTFSEITAVDKEPNCEIVTIDKLKSFSLNIILDCAGEKYVYIKLRTLMQYFGTNICRDMLADDIWIRQTISKAVDKAEARRLCLIPDVRFKNEAEAIKNQTDSLYGGVIKIIRNGCDEGEHSSEIIDFKYSYAIDNSSSLMVTFYQVLNYIQSII